jgi:hypothetical protein
VKKAPKQADLDRAFAVLEGAAVRGDRCPKSHGPESEGLDSQYVSALARIGRIAVEISSKNFRRVTILTGPNAGKSTAANPDKKARVYQTIDKGGTRVNGRAVDHGASSRRQPSLARVRFLEDGNGDG